MATLPRTKHGGIIASPFSTSPRKLQEVTLPTYDVHDVTAASGMSMRHYEEQLTSLKKENFNLKLRIYFLEEKLGTGSPPAVQGLLEHNVRLQVEVEELRRQLNDKQELLAAAAEAIDVLEQQGSISTDSVEATINDSAVAAQRDNDNGDKTETECPESESAGDDLRNNIDKDASNEIARLRREHRKALQMIKDCVKKIQQQDREIKKLKLNKELVYAQMSDRQLEKYEEILKCKDAHIKDLETKVKELQINGTDIVQDDHSGNLQELLAKRLQALAYFLDKLLSHKCVLGEEKKKLAESILEQSLAFPVGLELDESMAPQDFTLETSAELSRSLRLADLTQLLGHHGDPSDSDCWSEPDRRVSLARIGLAEKPRRRRASALRDDLAERLRHAEARCEELEAERNSLNELLAAERAKLIDASTAAAETQCALLRTEARLQELERQLALAGEQADRLRVERQELEATFAESEQRLRREAEEAALQASAAALERARAHNDRLRAERERDAARADLAAAADARAALELELAQRRAALASPPPPRPPPLPASDDDRPTSPDQGIDSDRLSSLEQNDALTLSPRSLYEENISLKQKLARTKATLADTLTQLNAANMKKRSVQRAICREIHKTQDVLRKARDQFENQNN